MGITGFGFVWKCLDLAILSEMSDNTGHMRKIDFPLRLSWTYKNEQSE